MSVIASILDEVMRVYPSLRPAFFGGLVSLAGFLFSVYGYTVIRMKESVYDTDAYSRLVDERRRNNPGLEHYGPLVRLSHLLFATILTALTSAVLQVTVGLAESSGVAVAICYSAVISTVTLVAFALITVWRNLTTWFSELEKAKRQPGR